MKGLLLSIKVYSVPKIDADTEKASKQSEAEKGKTLNSIPMMAEYIVLKIYMFHLFFLNSF